MAVIGQRRRRRPSGGQDTQLNEHSFPSFKDGYNSYAQTRSQIKDTEVSGGFNTRADDNGAMGKRKGRVAASPVLASGYAVSALGTLKTAAGTLVKLASAGTGIYAYTDSTSTLLTGATLTPTTAKYCRFAQAIGRTYFCNGVDQPYYTTNGTTLTMQTGAFPMRFPVFYSQRLYCVRPAYPDRLYYSNPIAVDITTTGGEPAGYTASNFGTYSVNLAASPVQNAGFIIFVPDSGVTITDVISKASATNDAIYVTTLENGIWEVVASASLNANGTVSHTIRQVIKSGGVPAPLSVFPSDNDLELFGSDNMYKLGEAALYQSLRNSPTSGRIQSDMRAIPASLLADVAGVSFKNTSYIAYGLGTYNDHVVVRDRILNAWSTPYTGWNVSCLQVVNETDGRQRLLAGSSNPSDSKVYELESGSDDAGTAIDASVRFKNTDLGHPGRIKRTAFANVSYSQIIGYVSYDVYIDGRLLKSDVWYASQSGQSSAIGTGVAGGIGQTAVGKGVVGKDGAGTGSSVSVATDSYFVIEVDYEPGEKIEIVMRDSTTSNSFKITRIDFYFDLGDQQERLI